jgi:hypothetical protein
LFPGQLDLEEYFDSSKNPWLGDADRIHRVRAGQLGPDNMVNQEEEGALEQNLFTLDGIYEQS